MKQSLYFYDLETSGFNPAEQRIMQFAGQRLDFDLRPIGDPFNTLLKMTDDILPDPYAIMLTGITPQKTIQKGINEAEFLKIFSTEISVPGTVFVGFNTVRFDDEFMRYLHYRNFYDPYEWQWLDGRGKWDLLDVARMTRALRPEGIKWPVENGKNVNRLVSLTKANHISHDGAHDALSDVMASIDLARLLQAKQPKLFSYLLNVMGNKKQVAELVGAGNPFVYTSGKYPSENEKTTVVAKLADHPKRGGALVFDLRFDPKDYASLSVAELITAWRRDRHDEQPRLPAKSLLYNRCPAIAPLGVLNADSQKRIDLNIDKIQANYQALKSLQEPFSKNILLALEQMDAEQEKEQKIRPQEVDDMLYQGFFADADKQLIAKVRQATPDGLKNLDLKFSDSRLDLLLPLYKARNFRQTLSPEEVELWEKFRVRRLLGGNENSRMSRFFKELETISSGPGLGSEQNYLLEELKLYGESILPVESY